MYKIFLGCLLITPLFSIAQSQIESVQEPKYYDDFVFAETDNYVAPLIQAGDSNISNSLIVEKDTQPTESTHKDPEIEITTEIGTTTITRATTTEPEQSLESLAEVVSRINSQYEQDSESCEIGSWFSRIWCKMTSWMN